MHADRARAFALVDVEIAIRQLLNVAVEIYADDLGVAIDDRTARIAADGVGRVDEVERGREVQHGFRVFPTRRQIVRRLLVEAGGAVEQSVEGRLERHERGVFFVAGDRPVFDPQIEVGVRIDRLAVDRETRVGDLLARAGLHVLDVLFFPGAKLADYRLDLAREDDERVVGFADGLRAAFKQGFAKRYVVKLRSADHALCRFGRVRAADGRANEGVVGAERLFALFEPRRQNRLLHFGVDRSG